MIEVGLYGDAGSTRFVSAEYGHFYVVLRDDAGSIWRIPWHQIRYVKEEAPPRA